MRFWSVLLGYAAIAACAPAHHGDAAPPTTELTATAAQATATAAQATASAPSAASAVTPKPKTDADCRQSDICRLVGRCVFRGGRCVVPAASDADCAQVHGYPSHGPCEIAGQCSAVDGVCQATSDDHCRSSNVCRFEARCRAMDGRCQATAADCAQSDECTFAGLCGARDGECVAIRVQDCETSSHCRSAGACAIVAGKCRPAKAEHCQRSSNCESGGLCKLRDGGCRKPLLDYVPAAIQLIPAATRDRMRKNMKVLARAKSAYDLQSYSGMFSILERERLPWSVVSAFEHIEGRSVPAAKLDQALLDALDKRPVMVQAWKKMCGKGAGELWKRLRSMPAKDNDKKVRLAFERCNLARYHLGSLSDMRNAHFPVVALAFTSVVYLGNHLTQVERDLLVEVLKLSRPRNGP